MFFSLYPTSIITTGHSKACIADINDARFVQIPLDMANFIQTHNQFDIDKKISPLNPRDAEAVMSYIEMLTKYHFGMVSEFFPLMSYNLGLFKKPFPIDSLIIDADCEHILLNTLRCLPHDTISRFVQIRLFFKPAIEFLNTVGNVLIEHNMLNVEMVFNKTENADI